VRIGRAVDALPLAAVLGVVWLGSSFPPASFPEARIWDYDKLLHLGEYAVVGLAIAFALRRSPATGVRAFLYIAVGGLLWAVSDELHQSFVGRDCSLGDLAADLCGLLVAATLAPRLPGFRRNRTADAPVAQGSPTPDRD